MSEHSQNLASLRQELSTFSNTESNVQAKLSQLSQTRAQISNEVLSLSKEYERKIKDLNQKLEEMQSKNEILMKENLIYKQDLEGFQSRLIEKEKLISMLILQQDRDSDRKSKRNLELGDTSKSKAEFYEEQKPVLNEFKETDRKVTNKSTPPPPLLPKRPTPQPPTKSSVKSPDITENAPSQTQAEPQSEEHEHTLTPKEYEEYEEPKIETNTINKYPISKPQTFNKRKPPQKPILYQQKYAEDLHQDNEEQETANQDEHNSEDYQKEHFQNLEIDNNQEQVDERENEENNEEINQYGVTENFNEANEITEETDELYQQQIVNENQIEQESYVDNYIEITEPPKKYAPPRKTVPSKTKPKLIPREFPTHNPFAEENQSELTEEIPKEISTEGGMYAEFQRESSEDFFTNLSKNQRESDNMIEAQESSIDYADNNSIASSAAHMLDSQFIPEEPTHYGRAGTESKKMTKKVILEISQKQNRREVRNLDPDSFV